MAIFDTGRTKMSFSISELLVSNIIIEFAILKDVFRSAWSAAA